MNQGALALIVHGGTENWSPERWNSRFDAVCGDRRVVRWPDAGFDPADIHYAAV
jgi:glyoxylate/hydroxypyruvate reductase